MAVSTQSHTWWVNNNPDRYAKAAMTIVTQRCLPSNLGRQLLPRTHFLSSRAPALVQVLPPTTHTIPAEFIMLQNWFKDEFGPSAKLGQCTTFELSKGEGLPPFVYDDRSEGFAGVLELIYYGGGTIGGDVFLHEASGRALHHAGPNRRMPSLWSRLNCMRSDAQVLRKAEEDQEDLFVVMFTSPGVVLSRSPIKSGYQCTFQYPVFYQH